MSWFADLGTTTMIDRGAHVRAVGWLSASQPFTVGDTSGEFLGRLKQFASHWGSSVEALGWGVYMGKHCCELCGGSNKSGNFGVPQDDILFVAPEMIGHYVEAHRYCPPAPFITAVMEAPLPETEEYRVAVTPFRQLHEQYLARRHQESIEDAAGWAHAQGGSEASISAAAMRFFGTTSQHMTESIRLALRSLPRV